jgi:hypothetical protein
VDTGSRRLRERFHDAFTETRAAGRKFLLQREMPVIPLVTNQSVSDQIRRQLGEQSR